MKKGLKDFLIAAGTTLGAAGINAFLGPLATVIICGGGLIVWKIIESNKNDK